MNKKYSTHVKSHNKKPSSHYRSSDGAGNTATKYPRGHEYHLPYIAYYKSIGFTQKQAEDFYYFTINAAPAELEKHNVITY